MRKAYFLLLCVFVLSVLVGCASTPSYVAHPKMVGQMEPAVRVGIIMSTRCFVVEAGGKGMLDTEQTAVMKTCMEGSAVKAFVEDGYAAKVLPAD